MEKNENKKSALETAIAQIEKQCGKGSIMRLGAKTDMEVTAVSSGSLTLDLALGVGGIPRGRITEIYGPESSGKTTVALHVIANVQAQGGEAAFIDAEHALDPVYAKKLGVDLDELYVSQPDTGEQALDITDSLIRSGAVDIYFAAVTRDFEIPGLTKTMVAASSQYVLLPRSHRLANRTTLSVKELDGESFVLYPRTKENSIRDFQLRNLKASGISYKVYESETSPLFYKLLVPIGKGLILSPRDMMDLPPNTVCISLTDIPFPAAPCFFYDRASLGEETEAFVRDYVIFAKEAHRREHRAAL